jgi:membrane-associated phospholipid phosphatase
LETILNTGITWNIFLQSLGAWLKTPMQAISFLGTVDFLLLLLPALYWCVEASLGLQVAIVLLLSTSVNDALKMVFHAPRPYWVSPDVIGYASEPTFGMPSGHAQMAVAVWGMLAASLRKGWGWLVAILIILLIGISRLYLGLHFPHDVILGWLIGALLLWLVLRFWQPVSAWVKRLNLGGQILAAFLASLVLILFSLIPFLWLKTTNWQPPQAWAQFAAGAISLNGAMTIAGMLFGLLAGLAWFNRQGGFSAAGSVSHRLLRLALGVVGILVLRFGLDALFGLITPDAEAVLPDILRYLRYSLVGAWVSAFAPWVFLKLKLAAKAS